MECYERIALDLLWKHSIIFFRAATAGLLKKKKLTFIYCFTQLGIFFSPSLFHLELCFYCFTSVAVPCIHLAFVIYPFTLLLMHAFPFSRGWGECFPSLELVTGENGATGERRGQCTWPWGPRQWCLWGTYVRHEWSWDAAEPQWLREQLWFSFCWQSDGILACLQPALQEKDEEDVKRGLFI